MEKKARLIVCILIITIMMVIMVNIFSNSNENGIIGKWISYQSQYFIFNDNGTFSHGGPHIGNGIISGNYTVNGNTLTFTYGNGSGEEYKVKIKGDKLEIIYADNGIIMNTYWKDGNFHYFDLTY